MTHKYRVKGFNLAYRDTGDKDAAAVVFVHAMSFDQDIWNDVIALMPPGLRIVSFDQRGHGGSDTPAPPYDLESYVDDAVQLLDHLDVRDCSLVGVSFGGLVAQGIAKSRPDIVKNLVLSNTATKIGTLDGWIANADEARLNGFSRAEVETSFRNLFSPAFLQTSALEDLVARRMRLSVEGYAGCCQAIGHADLTQTARSLEQPALVIGTDQDLVTPQEVVQNLATTLPHGEFSLISGAGHLPCIEKPQEFAERMISFFRRLGVIEKKVQR